MLKKIALGALLTGLVAVLIVGAVIRTNAQSGPAAGETGRRGQATERVAEDANLGNYGGRGSAANAEAGRGGWGTQDAGLGSLPQAEVQPEEWISIEGIVASAADDLIEIETAAGELIPFEGQPLRFALAEGLALQVGDAVTVSGFHEDGEFKISQVTNLASNTSVTLRDTSGRPGWSGRGRRG